MVKIIFGSEAYKIDAIKEQMLGGVDDFNKFSCEGFCEELVSFFSSMSLIPGRKVAVVTVEELSQLDNDKYRNLISPLLSVKDKDLLIIAKSADKRKKFVKGLLDKDFVKECGRCKDEAELGKIIRFEAKRHGKIFTAAAEERLIERSGYFVDDSVTLYHIKNLLLDLFEFADTEAISDTLVEEIIPENIIFDAFSITSLIESGDVGKIKKMTERLIQEKSASSIPCLSAMLFTFRTAYKLRMGFSQKEINYYRDNSFSKYSTLELLKCINVCTDTIEKIKRGEISDADSIMFCSLRITEVLKKSA